MPIRKNKTYFITRLKQLTGLLKSFSRRGTKNSCTKDLLLSFTMPELKMYETVR